MTGVVDTNVLVRLSDDADPDHLVVKDEVNRWKEDGRRLCLVPQIVYEFWAVATRPVENNGLGMSRELTDRAVDHWMGVFPLLRDERRIFHHWRELMQHVDVAGRATHDSRIVAAMKRHGITDLLTFDAKDFRRYDGITVVTPGAAA